MTKPQEEVYHLHPTGWETDPEEERFKLSTLDYITACTYNNYAVFFRLADADKPQALETFKAGLEKTLSQTRHLCGTIEKDAQGGHSFVKKRDSTVRLFVQWLDKDDTYPSLDEIEKANFTSACLGDLSTWSVYPMTYGEKPEAHPDVSPIVAAYKVNFIRGGIIFNMHHHHYANDVMGWAGLAHQLAENCRAIFLNDASLFPPWGPDCLDVSRLTKPEVPEESKVDGPAPPERHPAHTVASFLLFHLPKSKAAELKRRATPTDGSWISTYDAFSAFIWQTVSRLRAPVFQPDPAEPLLWSEAVDMRRRFTNPTVPARVQGNVMSAAFSTSAPVPAPSLTEVIGAPLPQLASYIRQLTNTTTPEALDQMLDMIAVVRDRTALNTRIDSFPPMSILQTDHRDVNITAADFGFAKPVVYRQLLDCVTEGVIIVYPPRDSGDPDEGCEFSIAYEKSLAPALIEDEEWKRYFEYRGVDAEDAGRSSR